MDELASLIQRRIANTTIDSSSARNMGPPGTIAATRTFLTHIDLKGLASRYNFDVSLEAATLLLKSHLPEGGQHWGSSRKFLNLFLANATYNHCLRQAFQLDKIEDLLELPLDSHCASNLIKEEPRLPRWRGVIHLPPEESALYQAAASHVAKRLSCSRVHLDLIYWRNLETVEMSN